MGAMKGTLVLWIILLTARLAAPQTVPGPCDARYSSIRSNHTMCVQDRAIATPVILTEQQEQDILDKHNEFRAQQIVRGAVGLMQVVWDEELAVIAAKWARQCTNGHDAVYQRFVPTLPGVDIGQNVGSGFSDFQSVMDAWYNEINNFQFGFGSTGGVVSHYTQIVSDQVSRIGCGQAVCLEFGQQRNYYVCNYAKMQQQLERPYCSIADPSTTCPSCLARSSLGLCDCGGKVCMNNGRINQATCQCDCSTSNYYTGASCETLTCPGFDRPFCTNPSNCDRFASYIAECPNSCGICPRTCNKVCVNGGTQNTIPCTCHCTPDYTGELCHLPNVNECQTGANNCNVNAVCTNTVGSFDCACNRGWIGDGVTCTDVNECQTGANNCNVNAVCTNTVGSFTCACSRGWIGDGVTCTDVNECQTGANNCNVNAVCTNTVGSFTCACSRGWIGDGVTCTDVNECQTGANNCNVNAVCTNMVGSFTCACSRGWIGDGVTCTDVDECQTGADNCNVNAVCTNTIGSFTCACRPGWFGDGVTCNDVNECSAGTSNCNVNAQCTNNRGSFTCTCNQGFIGDGFTCNRPSDVNECQTGANNCNVNAVCTNTVGSFTCACSRGWIGDGVTCTDVNECQTGANNCNVNAVCTNMVGSFTCACSRGWIGDGVTCTDVDECQTGADNCNVNAVCTNTIGSFTCACRPGWFGDGVTCNDVNECSAGTSNCNVNAQCTNNRGSFTCTCNQGFIGDGFTCNRPSGVAIILEMANVSSTVGGFATLSLRLSQVDDTGVWYKDGARVTNTSNRVTYFSGQYHYLTVFNAAESDAGRYSFRVAGLTTAGYITVTGTVNGGFGDWTNWANLDCSVTCGTGTGNFQRSRACDTPRPSNGGLNCTGDYEQVRRLPCTRSPCSALAIIVDLTPRSPQLGASAVFTAQLNQDNVQNGVWLKDNVRLLNSTKTIITVNGRTQQLVVSNVQAADAGTYTYTVNGVSSTSTLTVQGVSGWDQWSEWDPACPVTCGGPRLPQFRTRTCVNRQLTCNGEIFETRNIACNPDPCPVNGGFGDWTSWTNLDCSVTCGTGTGNFQRSRACDTPRPNNGGLNCTGDYEQVRRSPCTRSPCSVNGGFGDWTSWANLDCSVTCGTGTGNFQRSRACDTPRPNNGGLNCTGDYEQVRRSPCTRSPCAGPTQDLCSSAQRNSGLGYRYHPTDCDKFIQCYYNPNGNVNGFYRSCPFGFYWDQRTLRCDEPWKVTCPLERCSDKCTNNYGMSSSCRAYWQCNNDVSVPKCCMSGFMYEEGQGCRPNFFCRDTCPTACVDRDVCNKRPDWSGDIAAYNVSVGLLGWLGTRCVAGSYFDATDCGCRPLNSSCRADYDINFSDSGFLNNARASWLRDDNVTITNGIATFRSDSYFFANITKSTSTSKCPIIIKFRYRETTTVLGRRVLISTSDCKKGNSLVIAIDNDFITFEVTSWYGNPVKLPMSTAGYSRTAWKTVTFLYNGYEMIASIEGGRAKYSARAYAYDSTIMECGLTVGNDGMTNTPKFIGEMDQFTVYRCDPGNVV